MAQTEQERRQAAQPPNAESAENAAAAQAPEGAPDTQEFAGAAQANGPRAQRPEAENRRTENADAGTAHKPGAPAQDAQADAAGEAQDAAGEADGTAGTPEKAASKASKAGETASLKTKVEQLEKKLAESKDTLLRTAAEYENFRKRSAREHDAAFDNGVSFAVTSLLPVLDTLELAANAETADESYKKGVLMTLEQCRAAFEKMGVQEIEALGKPFNPELHAAVMQQPATEEIPSGTVAQVMQKGYLLHEKVVRHAMVAVAE